MSGKSRSNSIKNKSQSEDRGISSSNNNINQQTTSVDEKSTSKTTSPDDKVKQLESDLIQTKQELATVSSSMKDVQAKLDQLIAMQLQSMQAKPPTDNIPSAETEIKQSQPSQTPYYQPHTDKSESVQATYKPEDVQHIMYGLSQLFNNLQLRESTESISNRAPALVKAATNLASPAKSNVIQPLNSNVDYSTGIPPLEHSVSSLKIETQAAPGSNQVGPTPASSLEIRNPNHTSYSNLVFGNTNIITGSLTGTNSREHSPELKSQSAAPMQASSNTPALGRSVKPKPAALETKTEALPKAPKLGGNGSPSYDEFQQWWNLINDYIEAMPKFRAVLTEPNRAWSEFKRINSKYEPEDLESDFLDAHRIIWSYISGGLDDQSRTTIQAELQAKSKICNLPMFLNFNVIDPDFYKNCYELKTKLFELYGQTTTFRAVELTNQLARLHLKANEDPRIFFKNWRSITLQLRTVTGGSVPSEEQQVATILTKLPKELDNSLKPLLIAKSLNTLREIEQTMIQWYQATKSNNSSRTSEPKSEHKDKGLRKKKDSNASSAAPAAAAVSNVSYKGNKNKNSNKNKPQYQQNRQRRHSQPNAEPGRQVEGEKPDEIDKHL
jgi:hypothetical protein